MLVQSISLCPLKWEEAEKELIAKIYDHSFLTAWTDTIQTYITKINNRTLSEKEYAKIIKEIEQEGSILPTSPQRIFSYGGWSWDIILSETTGKIYCVDNDNDVSDLLSDYKGKQYYQSRSWASGEGYIIAW